MHLTDEQLATVISWAKKTPEVGAIFLSGSQAAETGNGVSAVDLALSIIGPDPFWRLATFLSHRRTWRTELQADLGVAVQLERDAGPGEAGYVELWRRA